MKKIIVLALAFLVVVNVGCEKTHTQPSNEPLIYAEKFNPGEDAPAIIETIYQDSEYRYVIMPYKKAYVEYKGK